MPMLKRGYGAVRSLCGKSGARFPPSTVWVSLMDLKTTLVILPAYPYKPSFLF